MSYDENYQAASVESELVESSQFLSAAQTAKNHAALTIRRWAFDEGASLEDAASRFSTDVRSVRNHSSASELRPYMWMELRIELREMVLDWADDALCTPSALKSTFREKFRLRLKKAERYFKFEELLSSLLADKILLAVPSDTGEPHLRIANRLQVLPIAGVEDMHVLRLKACRIAARSDRGYRKDVRTEEFRSQFRDGVSKTEYRRPWNHASFESIRVPPDKLASLQDELQAALRLLVSKYHDPAGEEFEVAVFCATQRTGCRQ